MKIPIEVSARHIHLDKKTADKLFGKNYKFKIKRELSQPSQYLCEEKIDLKNNENILKNVSILAPLREKTQVEVSLTDARKLKLSVPVRESGDIDNSPGCNLIGPKGEVSISEGVIVAKRHIHIPQNLKKQLNFKNGETVKISINTPIRSLIFDDVVVRFDPKFSLALHIDTDEGNAAGIYNKTYCEII